MDDPIEDTKRLTDADWRYQELREQAFDHYEGPAHGEIGTSADETLVARTKRWWWPFR